MNKNEAAVRIAAIVVVGVVGYFGIRAISRL